jgi:hypothetical protein
VPVGIVCTLFDLVGELFREVGSILTHLSHLRDLVSDHLGAKGKGFASMGRLKDAKHHSNITVTPQ